MGKNENRIYVDAGNKDAVADHQRSRWSPDGSPEGNPCTRAIPALLTLANGTTIVFTPRLGLTCLQGFCDMACV